METASENIPYISRLDTFEVREWGRFPSKRMHLGGVHRGNPWNEPQGIATVELKHLPKTGRLQAWTENLLRLTFCIFPIPNTIV